jgi:hypothetical protein
MDTSTRRLQIAVGAATAEVSVQVGLLLVRGALDGVALRPIFLLVKVPFIWAAWKRQPGGYLAVWIWEIAGVVAALYGRSELPSGVAIGVAAVVMVLLGRAISAYPTVEFKR